MFPAGQMGLNICTEITSCNNIPYWWNVRFWDDSIHARLVFRSVCTLMRQGFKSIFDSCFTAGGFKLLGGELCRMWMEEAVRTRLGFILLIYSSGLFASPPGSLQDSLQQFKSKEL